MATIDPHPSFLEAWRALRDKNHAALANGEDNTDLETGMNSLGEVIIETPATTAEGMAAKLTFFRERNFQFIDGYVDPVSINPILDEVIAFIGAGR